MFKKKFLTRVVIYNTISKVNSIINF